MATHRHALSHIVRDKPVKYAGARKDEAATTAIPLLRKRCALRPELWVPWQEIAWCRQSGL